MTLTATCSYLSILVAGLLPLAAANAPELKIPGISDVTQLVPVSVEGFNDEIAAAIRFDLEVAGFKVVTSDQALLRVSGTVGANLIGRVVDANRNSLLNRKYDGGSARAQAHAFSDDIVALLPGRKGIAQTRIAFRVEASRNSEIFIADYDGYGALAVTQDRTINRDPAWVPGKRALFYTSYRSGNPNIYAHDLQSGQRRLVAGHTGMNAAPAVSPDGRRLAMILSKAGSPDVYVSDIDGGNLRRLTSTKEDESSPCWSPDGRTLCFASRAAGLAQLYLVSAEGGPMRPLTVRGIGGGKTEPDWSPDGQTIVFTAMSGGFQICTVPATGGSATLVVEGEDPSWAPNSRTVIFTRRAGGQRTLSLLDVPTKQVKDIRRISGSYSQPAWAR